MKYIYLHGFASSPSSSKARYFARRMKDRGIDMSIPGLDEGRFETLTLSAQLAVIEREAAGQPSVLLGSSMGGYLAALAAARHAWVTKLVLLAPAFAFPTRWNQVFGAARLDEWKRAGAVPVFHYGEGRHKMLSYQLIEDATQYEDFPNFSQPALILHGRLDEVVPATLSEQFAATHANATLRLYNSGHELHDVMDQMWNETEQFLF
jgi:pimeloyl-ACP methyl ester carboxylesterase